MIFMRLDSVYFFSILIASPTSKKKSEKSLYLFISIEMASDQETKIAFDE